MTDKEKLEVVNKMIDKANMWFMQHCGIAPYMNIYVIDWNIIYMLIFTDGFLQAVFGFNCKIPEPPEYKLIPIWKIVRNEMAQTQHHLEVVIDYFLKNKKYVLC